MAETERSHVIAVLQRLKYNDAVRLSALRL